MLLSIQESNGGEEGSKRNGGRNQLEVDNKKSNAQNPGRKAPRSRDGSILALPGQWMPGEGL
jgi:hypothetical protein